MRAFLPGGVVGTVQIIDVEDDAADATVIEGDGFDRGQWLAPTVISDQPLETVR